MVSDLTAKVTRVTLIAGICSVSHDPGNADKLVEAAAAAREAIEQGRASLAVLARYIEQEEARLELAMREGRIALGGYVLILHSEGMA